MDVACPVCEIAGGVRPAATPLPRIDCRAPASLRNPPAMQNPPTQKQALLIRRAQGLSLASVKVRSGGRECSARPSFSVSPPPVALINMAGQWSSLVTAAPHALARERTTVSPSGLLVSPSHGAGDSIIGHLALINGFDRHFFELKGHFWMCFITVQ